MNGLGFSQSFSFRFQGTIDPVKWESMQRTMSQDFHVAESKLFQKENGGEIRFKMVSSDTYNVAEDQNFSIASAMKNLLIQEGLQPLGLVQIEN